MRQQTGILKLPPRVYADTSVYGGVFDEGFDLISRLFFEQVKQGRFALVTSDIVAVEVGGVPRTSAGGSRPS